MNTSTVLDCFFSGSGLYANSLEDDEDKKDIKDKLPSYYSLDLFILLLCFFFGGGLHGKGNVCFPLDLFFLSLYFFFGNILHSKGNVCFF